MNDILRTLLLLLLLCTCGRAQTYEVNVHPGQELLTIIQILADRYPEPNESNYQQDFEAHFRPFSDHPAVKAMTAMSERIYSDFPELGWCISDFPNCELYLPEENLWYEQYGKDSVQKVLKLAVDFAAKSDFWSFYQQHIPAYKAWSVGVRNTIDSLGYVEKLDRFYRPAAGMKKPAFYISMDPLNSWGAHAIPGLAEINPKFAHYKAYSLGYWNRESTPTDSPSFSSSSFLSNLVWHEGSHLYLNDLLESNADRIATIAYLHNGDEPKMRRQNIDDWSYCFEENLVRGIVISLSKKHLSQRRYKEAAAKEWSSGFIYAEDIADWLSENYLADKTATLANKLPALIDFLGAKYDKVPK